MEILNEYKSDISPSYDKSQENKEKSLRLSEEIRKKLSEFVLKHLDENDGTVNYISFGKSIEYKNFTELSEQLNFCYPEMFDNNEKLAFYLNIYNVLTIHSLTNYHANRNNFNISSVLEIPEFWQKFAYKIGQHSFSLDDIEHGILRGNEPHPSTGKIMFGTDDPRKKLSLSSLDPRIHFALNCGAKSCPMVRAYSPLNIDQKLNLVTTSYLMQEIQFTEGDKGIKNLHLPKIFEWYGIDFGPNLKDILRWMMTYIDGDLKQILQEILESNQCQERVMFIYDWSIHTNVSI